MTSDTPRVAAVPDWSARCEAQDDEKIITHGDLLALAHNEANELRELASTLERKLDEAQANILVKDTAWMQRAIDAEAKLAAKPDVAGLVEEYRKAIEEVILEYDQLGDAPSPRKFVIALNKAREVLNHNQVRSQP